MDIERQCRQQFLSRWTTSRIVHIDVGSDREHVHDDASSGAGTRSNAAAAAAAALVVGEIRQTDGVSVDLG